MLSLLGVSVILLPCYTVTGTLLFKVGTYLLDFGVTEPVKPRRVSVGAYKNVHFKVVPTGLWGYRHHLLFVCSQNSHLKYLLIVLVSVSICCWIGATLSSCL